jgi:hypothetical protein
MQYRNFIAARRTQTSARKFQVLKAYTQFRAARRIQTCWRCTYTLAAFVSYIAARRIQTTRRCTNAHGTYKTYMASRTIQTMWRCRHLRRAFVFFAAKAVSRPIGEDIRSGSRTSAMSLSDEFKPFCWPRRFVGPYQRFLNARKVKMCRRHSVARVALIKVDQLLLSRRP